MKRTARLVRLALEGRAPAPEPWLRGAADVAAAVAKSGANSRREGAPAAGGRGGVTSSSRDASDTAGAPSGAPGRQFAHAAGGPGAFSSLDIANVAGGPGAISARHVAHAAGGPGAFSSRDIAHAAGGPGAISSLHVAHAAGVPVAITPRDITRAAGGPVVIDIPHAAGGVISARDLTHAAGGAVGVTRPRNLAHDAEGLGVASVRELATPCPGSGHEGSSAVMEKGKGGGGVVRADGDHYSLQGSQGGRGATEDIRQYQAKGGARVESKATAGPGRGIALSASLPAEGCDTHHPDSSASSSKVCSITLHDKLFVSCKDYHWHGAIAGDQDEWSTGIDVSDAITSCLTHSVDPIASFRIDSSKWTDSKYLEKWLEVLSKMSVQEVDVLNLGHSVGSLFPINRLDSSKLKHLRIGFFNVNLDLLCFNYTSLHTLEFFSCMLEGNKLSWVVKDCPVLKVLKVHHCFVDLHVTSDTLQHLDCVGNIGSRAVIACAPNLLSVGCGIIAEQKKSAIARQKIMATVFLSDVPCLKFLEDLNLQYNKILFDAKDLSKVAVPLPSVIGLSLSLEMSKPMQLQNLRKILESFPTLESLTVVRTDNVANDEGFYVRIDKPFEDAGMLDCVKSSLKSFSLQEFRGGESENHLIKCLLKNSPHLIYLGTKRCKSSSKRAVRHAVKLIKSFDMASEVCQFSFK